LDKKNAPTKVKEKLQKAVDFINESITNYKLKESEKLAKNKNKPKTSRCVNNNIFYTSTEEGGIGLRSISSSIEQEQMRFMKVCLNDNIDPLTKELILRKKEKMKIENNWNI
jgi:hypothetical protein